MYIKKKKKWPNICLHGGVIPHGFVSVLNTNNYVEYIDIIMRIRALWIIGNTHFCCLWLMVIMYYCRYRSSRLSLFLVVNDIIVVETIYFVCNENIVYRTRTTARPVGHRCFDKIQLNVLSKAKKKCRLGIIIVMYIIIFVTITRLGASASFCRRSADEWKIDRRVLSIITTFLAAHITLLLYTGKVLFIRYCREVVTLKTSHSLTL